MGKENNMTGEKHYYKIPLLTRIFKRLKFYISWRDDKFYKMGFNIERKMDLIEAISRLERKRLWREQINNK